MPNSNAGMSIMSHFVNEPSKKRELDVIYVLDASGSMSVRGDKTGTRIEVLNRAMKNTVSTLRDTVESGKADADVKIGVLVFATEAKWMTFNGFESIEDFMWTDLKAGGLTNINRALDELNRKLKTDNGGFMASHTSYYKPVIIFMTDGEPTCHGYKEELDKLRANTFYKRATKVGFALGDDDEMSEEAKRTIIEIVGNPECVLKTTDLSLFASLIEAVSSMSVVQNSNNLQKGENGSNKDPIVSYIDNLGIDSYVTEALPEGTCLPPKEDNTKPVSVSDIGSLSSLL